MAEAMALRKCRQKTSPSAPFGQLSELTGARIMPVRFNKKAKGTLKKDTHCQMAVGQNQWDPVLVGEFITHFSIFIGDWDVHWG